MVNWKKFLIFAGAAVVYFLLPVDLIPDVAPIVGWIDDVCVAIILAYLGFK